MFAPFPISRPRRLRRTAALRRLTAASGPGLPDMLWPVFVVAGENQRQPIDSMPGQERMSADELCRSLEPLVARGLGGLMLFGVEAECAKTPDGARAWDENGIVPLALRRLKQAYPELPLFTDVCLCGYTDHGHCGLWHCPDSATSPAGGCIDNDATLPLLARMALTHAAAGADGVAPSAMMDGQVAAIRQALEAAGHHDTVLLSYSTKFASALYGPFRDAAESAPRHGDRRSYQADPANLAAALRESVLDEAEGADILMVKPATFYLDVIQRVRQQTSLPLAAYNVSGEYAMLHSLAAAGGGDLPALVRENLLAIRRAGADIILTYWAKYHAFFET